MKKTFTNLGRIVSSALIFLVCSFSNATTYYISSSEGNDSYSSAQAQNQNTPWKSLNKLNSIFSSLQPGDQILFKNGDTFQGTLYISKSGSAGAPITFGNYGTGKKPIITSLSSVTKWTSLGGNIYEANINVADALNVVLMNGSAQAMGRFPNADAKKKGFLTINTSGTGSLSSSELQAPSNFSGAEIVIRKNNWIIDRHYINYHSGNSIGYNTSGSYYSPHVGFGFFIQNHPGTLDQNGEWYFNKQNKTIQIYYDKGNPSSADIQVALNNQVVEINSGVSNITFSNLSILGANENLVNLSSSSNISFISTELKFAGKNGVNAKGTKNFTIQNSLIEDTYNSGLFFQWQDDAIKVLNNTFNRNFVFPGMGRNGDLNGNTIYMSGDSGNGLIQNNKILNSGYQGINFNGNNTVVKNNLVDTFCFVKDDGAGIYTYTGSANTTLYNREVVNNIVINGIGAVDGTKPYGPTDFPYVEGIYMDDNSSGVKISGNTIANIASSGIYIHNSRSIEILDNNIYNTGKSIQFVHDNLGNPVRNINLKKNNFLAKHYEQSHVFVRSKLNDVNMMGTFDQNVFSKPPKESNTIQIQTPSINGLLELQNWINNFGLDINSKKSPVAFNESEMGIDEFILFEFNYSSNSKTFPLSGKYVDLEGKVISGSITIPAYSSVILLKTEFGPESLTPVVAVTSPEKKELFYKGEQIQMTADAAVREGEIAQVQFFSGETLLATDKTFPYKFTWTTPPAGNHKITVKAKDNNGQEVVSEPVQITVNVNPNKAPLANILSPLSNAKYIEGSKLTINTKVSDSDGNIAKVQFFKGTKLLGTVSNAPYKFSWTKLPVGTHQITVKAFDNKGKTTVSKPVKIIVSKKPNVAPKVKITSLGGINPFQKGDNISITAKATDSDGKVAKVQFYKGSKLLGEDKVAPYKFDWKNLPAGNHSIKAKAIDNEGKATISEVIQLKVSPNANQAPKVQITSPGSNKKFEKGQVIKVTAKATDVDGKIAKVQFFKGTKLLGTFNIASYTYSLKNLPIGLHKITVKATDNKGKVSVSKPLTIRVIKKPNVAPVVKITSPGANASFNKEDNIIIKANASDKDGKIAKVQFYAGSKLLGVDKTSGYQIAWKNLPAGTHKIKAKATDNEGKVTVSAPVIIKVSNKVNLAPIVKITSPGAKTTLINGEKIVITADASDSDGSVAKVEFFAGNQLIGTDKTAPYRFASFNLPIGVNRIIAKATDNKGKVTVSKPIQLIIEKTNIKSPFNGKWAAIPGIVQAENFDLGGEGISYHDSDQGNNGEIYRNENVDLGKDNKGGYTVGWINLGEWIEYSANIKSAGSYTLETQIASPGEGGTFHIECDGIDVTGTLSVPATGDWDTWKTITTNNVKLPQGKHVLRYVVDSFGPNGYWGNLNSFKFTKSNDAYRINVSSDETEKTFKNLSKIESIEAEAGEKVIVFAEDEENMVFDHWEIDGVKVSELSMFEIEMPDRDINVTKHFRPLKTPEVRIVLPDDQTEFEAFSSIFIGLASTDNDAKIKKVELFNGNFLIGELPANAKGLDWKNIPAGSHELVAKLTDSNGNHYFSEKVSIEAKDQRNVDIKNILLEYAIGPNPTQDYLNVIFKNLDGIYDFEFNVVSMTGIVQKTINSRPENSKITIDVSDLKNGVYVLHLISNGNNISSKKFIKK